MNQTLLLGLDGATFTILDPLMEEGIMPFLKGFIAGGVRAELLSTPHPLTPPAFTSLLTGRSPGIHGIYDFIKVEEREGSPFFTLYDSRDVRCETLWSIANRQKRKVISLNFVLTSPVKPLNGCVIPGMVHWRHLRRHTYPENLYERIKSLPGFDAKKLAWDFKQEEKALHLNEEIEYEGWILHHIEREKGWFQIMRYLMKEEPADLAAIVFDGGDKIQHLCWQFLDPGFLPSNPSGWERRMRELALTYFRNLDNFLQQLVEMAGPEARVFIASDHGFGPTRLRFRVNQFLTDKGYLKWNERSDSKDTVRTDSDVVDLDWENTLAYARTRSSNGVYIRSARKPGDKGIRPEEYSGFRNKLAQELLDFKDPETGEKVVSGILFPEETFPGPASDQAPDLTLVLSDRSFVSISRGYPVVEHRKRVGGTHYPEGIFLAKGKGINKGTGLGTLSILDIMPAVLYSLGLPVPEDLEGKFPTSVFQKEYLETNPAVTGPATEKVWGPESQIGDTYNEAEKKEVYEHLKALGYME